MCGKESQTVDYRLSGLGSSVSQPRERSRKRLTGLGFVWVDAGITDQTAQTRNSRLREEGDEFTSGYFEFGTFMSPSFLFLVSRNLKTKWLGFGIESNVFPQRLPLCGYNKKELMTMESSVKMAIIRLF